MTSYPTQPLVLMAVLSLCFTGIKAQNNNRSEFALPISRTTAGIRIDGAADEEAWLLAAPTTPFVLNAPVDNAPPTRQTVVKMLHDAENLYLLAICYDDEDLVVQTLKRDGFGNSDEFAVLIDPVGNKTNGFGFGVNAFGAQTEVAQSPNGSDASWDNRWFSAVSLYPDRWQIEIKIPLKSIRFKEGQAEWGINFARVDPGSNEISVWAPVPRQFDFDDIGYFGSLVFTEAPVPSGGNVSLIPYTSVRSSNVEGEDELQFAAGGDAKIALSPAMNLDLTTFSDFSQVEVDAQVTNLTRFNIFFPERRQFFIENNDIFDGFGQGENLAFYSRRIGLNPFGQPTPILYGARLTGNVGPALRIGAFNMQTKSTAQAGGDNFSALAFQQRVLARSQVRGIFLNRQGFEDGQSDKSDFGRNLGGDFLYVTNDGKIEASAGYLHSMKGPELNTRNGQLYGGVAYNGQRFRGFVEAQHVGENFFTDMGFNSRIENYDPVTDSIIRIGYTSIGSMLNYYIYPEDSKNVNFHWSGLENFVWINAGGTGLNEWYTRLRHFLFFKNTSALRFRLNNNYVQLLYPFELTSTPLPTGDYNMTEFNIQYDSDTRKRWQYQFFGVYGQFFGGTKHTYRARINYRVQPWGNFSVGVEHNDIQLDEPYGRAKITLGTARVEVNFSTRFFWTTFFQYNTQADNFNINSRVQYRFAPMSDVFLVYTDNYAIEGLFGNKNRSLVLKVNYWLTI